MESFFKVITALAKSWIGSIFNQTKGRLDGLDESLSNIDSILQENGGKDPKVAELVNTLRGFISSASGALPEVAKTAKQLTDEAAAAAKAAAAGTQVALADPAAPNPPPPGQKPPAAPGKGPAG